MCKTCTNLTHTNLERVHSIHFDLWAFVVKVRDIDNPGQNVWDKVPFSRIAAIFACSPPPHAMLDDSSESFSLRTTLHGGRGEVGFGPKNVSFQVKKLIDGRDSAFCKLVPHTFGQDCGFFWMSCFTLLSDGSALY